MEAAAAAAMSQLQLQLLSLVSDHRILRERERAAREELQASIQRWKEAEEGHRREARELRAEVAARDDALRRLESRVKCLENENEQLENNEKELKDNMEGLLQSREAFIKHYEDSACSLQWTIQLKDKQIAVISEKLNAHLALFSSVGKEAAAVKQVLGDVKCLVGDKENVVSDLKGKVEKISVLEKDFVENLKFFEEKISKYQLELQNRARMIYELREQLEAEKHKNKFQPQVEELRKSLLVKDEIIERLRSEKQEMLMELHNMEIALRKLQDIFGTLGHEVMKRCSPVSNNEDARDVNKEHQESIPGSQCESPNEHAMIPGVDETGTTPKVECQSEIDPGSKQTQSQSSLMHSPLPSQKPGNANAETAGCRHGSEDIDMDNSSPAQQNNLLNPNLESQNEPTDSVNQNLESQNRS